MTKLIGWQIQTWIVDAIRLARKRYLYTVVFTVTFTSKSGNVYKSSWRSLFLLIYSKPY